MRPGRILTLSRIHLRASCVSERAIHSLARKAYVDRGRSGDSRLLPYYQGVRLLRNVLIVNIMIQNSIVFLVAFGLIGLAVGQFFVSNISLRRMRRRQSSIRQTQLEQLRYATKIARLNSQLSTSGSDQQRQWRVMEVLKVIDESKDAKSFYLADPNQQALPAFHPGQYLMIRPALAGKYQATRCYSLSVAPNSKLWRITVKKQATVEPLKQDRKSGGLST